MEVWSPLHTEPKEKKTGVISVTDTAQEAGLKKCGIIYQDLE